MISPKQSNRRWYVIGGLVIGCLVVSVLGVIGLGGLGALPVLISAPSLPTQSAIVQATLVPIPVTGVTPTAVATPIVYSTYQSTHAPFSVQYPADWTKSNQGTEDHEVIFVSPDLNAFASVVFGDGAVVTAEEGIDQIVNHLLVEPKVISKQQNADGSYTVELEYTKDTAGTRAHAFIRAVVAGTMYYVVQFSVNVDEYEQYRVAGTTLIHSFTLTK